MSEYKINQITKLYLADSGINMYQFLNCMLCYIMCTPSRYYCITLLCATAHCYSFYRMDGSRYMLPAKKAMPRLLSSCYKQGLV